MVIFGHHFLPGTLRFLPWNHLFFEHFPPLFCRRFPGLWQHMSTLPASHIESESECEKQRESAGSRFVLVLKPSGCVAVSHYISCVAGMLWAEVCRKLMAHGQRHLFKFFSFNKLANTTQREWKCKYVYFCMFRFFPCILFVMVLQSYAVCKLA